MLFIWFGGARLDGSGCLAKKVTAAIEGARFVGGTSPSQGEGSFLLPHLRSASMCRRQRRKTGMKRQMERSSIRSEATLLTTDNIDLFLLLLAMSSMKVPQR